jgi:hypothetical protein
MQIKNRPFPPTRSCFYSHVLQDDRSRRLQILHKTRVDLNINLHQRRRLGLSIWGPLVPPLVFFGLGLTLWTYKCIMMVLFQNKIIYMPNVPPFARSETVDSHAKRCLPVAWREESVMTADGVRLSLLVGDIRQHGQDIPAASTQGDDHLAVLYFQG